MENAEYLVIYKGDDTDFTLNQSVFVDIHTETSLEGLTAVFRFHNFKQSFSPIPEDKRLKLSIPKCASDRFPLGFSTAKVEFIDSEGNVRTVCSQLRVLVTKFVTQAYYNPDHRAITVNFSADGGTKDYNELENKPQINGVEVKGALSLDDLGVSKGNARALPPYLHEMSFDDSYKADAEAWYESHSPSVESGACSACYKNGKLGRRYDWQFDSAAEFVVRMSEGKNEDGSRRYASVGVASLGNELTEEMVVSGKYTDMYRVLPGRTVDGVNDAGVAVEVNVIPRSEDDPVKGEGKMHPWGVVRYVLDRFDSAEKAANYIKDHYYIPDGNEYAYHWMIADKVSGAWIVEDGHAFKIDASAMTNFRVQRVAECMTDGKVDRAKLAGIDPYGTGTERWDVLATAETVEAALAGTKWTDLYVEGTEPVRLSDFAEVGYATVDETEKLEAARQIAIAKWAEGERESHRDEVLAPDVYWWQSVHVSVYDLENKTLTLSVQEEDKAFVFAVNAGGAGTSLDEKRNAVDYRALRRICDIWTWERVAADPSEGLVETPADFIEVANMTNAAYPEFNEVSSDWWYAGIYWPNGRFRYEATSGLAGSATTADLVYAFVSYDEEGHEIARFRAKATRDPSKVNDRRIEPPDAYGGNAFARIATTEWVHFVVEKAKGWAKDLLPEWLTPSREEPPTQEYVGGIDTKAGNALTKAEAAESKAGDALAGLEGKADKSTTYTKTEVDTAIAVKRDKTDLDTYISKDKVCSWTYFRGGTIKPIDVPLYDAGQTDRVRWRVTSPYTDISYFPASGRLTVSYKPSDEVLTEDFDLEPLKDPKSFDPTVNDLGGPYTLSNGQIIEFNRSERGAIEPDGDSLARVSQIPPSVALDDTVTETSVNGVKSSGIWTWVKGLLPDWLTKDYAEPATVKSLEDKLDLTSTYEVWDSSKTYTRSYVVSHKGKIWRFRDDASVATTTTEPKAGSDIWVEYPIRDALRRKVNNTSVAPAFIANHQYKAGERIVNDGTLYKAKADFTSGAAFRSADWETDNVVSALAGKADLGADGKVLPSQLPEIPAGETSWGSIKGDLEDQEDLKGALAGKRGITDRMWLGIKDNYLPITNTPDATKDYDWSSYLITRSIEFENGFSIFSANGLYAAELNSEGRMVGGDVGITFNGKLITEILNEVVLDTDTLALTSEIPAPVDVIDPASATTTGKAADAFATKNALGEKRDMTNRVFHRPVENIVLSAVPDYTTGPFLEGTYELYTSELPSWASSFSKLYRVSDSNAIVFSDFYGYLAVEGNDLFGAGYPDHHSNSWTGDQDQEVEWSFGEYSGKFKVSSPEYNDTLALISEIPNVSAAITNHNTDRTAHADIRSLITQTRSSVELAHGYIRDLQSNKLDKSDVVAPHEATEKGKAADAFAVQKVLSNKREKLDNAEYTGTVKQSWWKYGEAVINYEGKTGSYSFSWGANVGDKTIQIVYSSYNGSLIFKYLGGDTIGEAVIAAGLNPESLDEAVNNLGGPYVFGEHKFEFEPTRCCTYTPTGHRFAVGAKVAGTEEPFYADENGIIEIPVDVSDKRDQFDREWYTKDDENFAIYQWTLHTEQPATLENVEENANDLNLSATLDRVIRWNQTAHAWTDLQSIGTTYKITGVYENGEWKFALRVNGTDALIMEWSGFSVEKTVDGTLYKVSAEIRKFALTRDDVPWVNEKSIVVGTPKDDKTNGDSTMAVGFRCYNLAVKSVAFGNEASTVKDNSMAVGNNSQANGVSSVALGHNACTGSAKDDIRASHDRAFCWNGQNLTGGQYYFSKGAGTFCINPDGGLAGTYVGDKKLSECFAEKVGTASVQTPSESSTIDEVASAKGTWDLLKAQGVHFEVVTTESGENELKITLGQPNS